MNITAVYLIVTIPINYVMTKTERNILPVSSVSSIQFPLTLLCPSAHPKGRILHFKDKVLSENEVILLHLLLAISIIKIMTLLITTEHLGWWPRIIKSFT